MNLGDVSRKYDVAMDSGLLVVVYNLSPVHLAYICMYSVITQCQLGWMFRFWHTGIMRSVHNVLTGVQTAITGQNKM